MGEVECRLDAKTMAPFPMQGSAVHVERNNIRVVIEKRRDC